MCAKPPPDLDSAYALKTPQDSRRLYADWAQTYDSGFAQESEYVLPQKVARHFAAAGGTGPVLDVGAGTGLCAQALKDHGVAQIDGTDISPDMLRVAQGKGLYERLFVADVTARLPIRSEFYAGVVSSGTFTNGHVGPEAIEEVLRITRPGGLLALSINCQHYETKGFARALDGLATQIRDLRLPVVEIYGANGSGAHKDDTCYVALFCKS